MVNIAVNDILDELREENNRLSEENKRLLNENKLIYELLDKYRNFSLDSEICVQKSNKDFVFKSLEEEYQKLFNQKKDNAIKIETIDKPIEKSSEDKQTSPQNVDKNTNGSENIYYEESTEDMDTNCEVIDGNDCQTKDDLDKDINETKNLWNSWTQFVCDYKGCNKTYKDKLFYIRHIRSHQISPNVAKTTDGSEDNECEILMEDMDTDCEEINENASQTSDGFTEISSLPTQSRKKATQENKVFECPECPKTYSLRHNLVKHQRMNHLSNLIECNVCDFRTVTKQGLHRHTTLSHSNAPTLMCEYEDCYQMFPHKESLEIHQKTEHKEPGIKCDFEGCHKLFKTNLTLKKHKRIVHKKEPTRCDFVGCGRVFKNAFLARSHKKSFHLYEQIVCEWPGCGQTYKHRQLYRDHMLTHTMEKQLPCKVEGCFKVLCSPIQFRNHMLSHFPCKNFKCSWPGCDQAFHQNDKFLGHLNKEHKNVRPFKCPFEGCPKAFYCANDLRNHKKFLHINKKPEPIQEREPVVYKCNDCVFESQFESQLKAHTTRKHLNQELTVKCTFEGCTKMFRSKMHMGNHLVNVHTFNRFHCEWPGCEFSTHCQRTFADHKRYHIGKRDYKCDFEGCSKGFITAKTLRQHKLSHLKKFVCSWPECGQRFSQEVYLTAHMNRHLNLRPFKCSFNDCNKDFKIDLHLKHHLRTVHKIKAKDITQG